MTTLSRPAGADPASMVEADSARATVVARLAELKSQRAQAEFESVPPGAGGDLADRSGNVEAMIRLENLEARIVALELRLDEMRFQTGANDLSVAALGTAVTLSFGADDSVETFRLDRIEHARPGDSVITPESPLGQALLGARAGDRVTYRAGGTTRTAELLQITD